MSKRSMLAVTVAAMVAFSAPMFVSAEEATAPKFTENPLSWVGAKFGVAKDAASAKLGGIVDPTGEVQRLEGVVDALRTDNDSLRKQMAIEEERRYIVKEDMQKLIEAVRTLHTLAITGRLQHLVVEVPDGKYLESKDTEGTVTAD